MLTRPSRSMLTRTMNSRWIAITRALRVPFTAPTSASSIKKLAWHAAYSSSAASTSAFAFCTASGLPAMCTNASSRMCTSAPDSLLMPLMRAPFAPITNGIASFSTATRQFCAAASSTHVFTAPSTSSSASLACTSTTSPATRTLHACLSQYAWILFAMSSSPSRAAASTGTTR